MLRFLTFFTLLVTLLFSAPSAIFAQNTGEDVFRGKVIKVDTPTIEETEGMSFSREVQEVVVEIRSRERKGERVSVSNDLTPVSVGDRIFLRKVVDGFDAEEFFILDIDRRGSILLVVLGFLVVIVLFSGWKGVRSVFSLIASFSVIFFILIPLLLKGYAPVLVVSVVSAIILASVMYITHGVNRITHAAFLSTTLTVIGAGVLSWIVVRGASLTGFADDNAVFLNASTGGTLDLSGLLLGGMIIGVLGLLDDIAITQAATVAELKNLGKHLTPRELYTRAMRIGREHIGALVNTLALAYAGVALPLLMLFVILDAPVWFLVNQEVFATEIVRTAIGGLALVLAVPITTLFAIRLVRDEDAEHGHTH